MRELKIGELAEWTGTSVPTIRYYEQIGLLPRAPRQAGGQRVYGRNDVERLTFIRRVVSSISQSIRSGRSWRSCTIPRVPAWTRGIWLRNISPRFARRGAS